MEWGLKMYADLNTLRNNVQDQIGEPVLYHYEINKIVAALTDGERNFSDNGYFAVREKLMGILDEHGLNASCFSAPNFKVPAHLAGKEVFPVSEVWKSLNMIPGIFEDTGISTLEELLDRGYHVERCPAYLALAGCDSVYSDFENESNSVDNGIKALEEAR